MLQFATGSSSFRSNTNSPFFAHTYSKQCLSSFFWRILRSMILTRTGQNLFVTFERQEATTLYSPSRSIWYLTFCKKSFESLVQKFSRLFDSNYHFVSIIQTSWGVYEVNRDTKLNFFSFILYSEDVLLLLSYLLLSFCDVSSSVSSSYLLDSVSLPLKTRL